MNLKRTSLLVTWILKLIFDIINSLKDITQRIITVVITIQAKDIVNAMNKK